MLFCCLRRIGVTLRLHVINTSSSISREQQTMPLIATSDECHQLATVRRSCVYNTWRSNHSWQHAIKPHIGRQSPFSLPCVHSTGGGGSRRNIAITFGLVRNGSTEYTNVTDGRTDTAWRRRPRLCIALRGKNDDCIKLILALKTNVVA